LLPTTGPLFVVKLRPTRSVVKAARVGEENRMGRTLADIWEAEWMAYCVKRTALLETMRASLDGHAVPEKDLARARAEEQEAFDAGNAAFDEVAHVE
jgi:hypothetical protein